MLIVAKILKQSLENLAFLEYYLCRHGKPNGETQKGTEMKKVRATTWNTYRMTGYTHDVANDQASAGGVHYHEIRRSDSGGWQYRVCQSNGRHSAYGPVEVISDEDGEARFEAAKQYLMEQTMFKVRFHLF